MTRRHRRQQRNALCVLFCAFVAFVACGPIIAYHEGPWRFIGPPPGAAGIWPHLRVCAAGWAGVAPYDDPFYGITWVQVQGSAIRSGSDWAKAEGAKAQTRAGDTVLIVDDYWHDQAVIASEELHVLQNHHPELALGNWYVPGLWDACGVPLPRLP